MTTQKRKSSVFISDSECAEIRAVCATVKNISFSQARPQKYSPRTSVFNKTGYIVGSKIASTLQGSIYNIINEEGNKAVLKRASVQNVSANIGVVNGKVYDVEESIIKEAKVLQYLNSNKHNAPNGLINYIDFFDDGSNYFLLMQNGGISLLKHVQNMHKLIQKNILSKNEYSNHVKTLFTQMVKFVDWMHNTMNVAHLDISLENILVSDVKLRNGRFVNHGKIYFIDYGLATMIKGNRNNCKKFVGKTNYKYPKIYNKQSFNPRKADIWSLTVCLYIMQFGHFLYLNPNDFNLKKEMIHWNKHASKELADIFYGIFSQKKSKIKFLINHKYFK